MLGLISGLMLLDISFQSWILNSWQPGQTVCVKVGENQWGFGLGCFGMVADVNFVDVSSRRRRRWAVWTYWLLHLHKKETDVILHLNAMFDTSVEGYIFLLYFTCQITIKQTEGTSMLLINHQIFGNTLLQCYIVQKNKERHTAGTIVSWPNPKQWVIVHTSDLMTIIRQSIYIISIITTEKGKLKTYSSTYCIMDNGANMLNLTHTLDKIYLTGIL